MKIDRIFIPGEKITIVDTTTDPMYKNNAKKEYTVIQQYDDHVFCVDKYGIHRCIHNHELYENGVIDMPVLDVGRTRNWRR